MTLRQPPLREGAKSNGFSPADELVIYVPSTSVDGFFIVIAMIV